MAPLGPGGAGRVWLFCLRGDFGFFLALDENSFLHLAAQWMVRGCLDPDQAASLASHDFGRWSRRRPVQFRDGSMADVADFHVPFWQQRRGGRGRIAGSPFRPGPADFDLGA